MDTYTLVIQYAPDEALVNVTKYEQFDAALSAMTAELLCDQRPQPHRIELWYGDPYHQYPVDTRILLLYQRTGVMQIGYIGGLSPEDPERSKAV